MELPSGNRRAVKAAGDDSGWFCSQCYFPGASRTGEDKYTAAQVCSRAAEQGELVAHHSISSDCCRPQPQCGLRLPSDFSVISFSVSAAKESSLWLYFSFTSEKPKQISSC